VHFLQLAGLLLSNIIFARIHMVHPPQLPTSEEHKSQFSRPAPEASEADGCGADGFVVL